MKKKKTLSPLAEVDAQLFSAGGRTALDKKEREEKRVGGRIHRYFGKLIKDGKYLIGEAVTFSEGPRKGTAVMHCSLVVSERTKKALQQSAILSKKSEVDLLKAILRTNEDAEFDVGVPGGILELLRMLREESARHSCMREKRNARRRGDKPGTISLG